MISQKIIHVTLLLLAISIIHEADAKRKTVNQDNETENKIVKETNDDQKPVVISKPLNRPQPTSGLYFSKECQDDITRYCPKAKNMVLTDMAVLQCIHNEVADLSLIDKDCHHLLFEAKMNLTIRLQNDSTPMRVCSDDLPNLKECSNIRPEETGHMLSCLISNLDNVTNYQCRRFLTNVAALVFSDYRLIYNFIDDCSEDIKRYSCGRIERITDPDADKHPTQQGKTIECLSKHFTNLASQCTRQIIRIAELQSDDFHLDRTLFFACRDDRERFCDTVSSGQGRVYKCLMRNKFNQLMSKECQEELTKRQKIISEDASADRSMIIACKKDILRYECRDKLRDTKLNDRMKLANVILCLEGAVREGNSLDPECKSEILEHRKALMSDYQINPYIATSCANEINTFCNGGNERGGRTLHCLLRKAKVYLSKKASPDTQFSDKCIAQLRNLIRIADPSEDIRVDPDLKEACLPLLEGQCRNVEPGQGRVIECLLKFMNTPSMSDDCEERLLEIQFFISRDWRLTPSLFKECRDDAVKFCSAKSRWNDWSTDVDNGPLVLPCLYHHIHEQEDDDDKDDDDKDDRNTSKEQGISKGCVAEVKRVMNLRAANINLLPQVQDQCAEDLARYCSDTNRIGKGEETRCLQLNFKNLEDDCKKALTEFTKEENKDIRLDQILMKACTPTIDEFCAAKKDQKNELLVCLIEQKNNGKMDEKCRIGIEHHQLINLQNVEFNMKFKKTCKHEILDHCSGLKTKLEVIQCLSEIVLNDTLLDMQQRIGFKCRRELRYELLQLNEDIKLDSSLSQACEQDVAQLCSNIKSGQGQVLECLRSQTAKLSPECRAKLFKRDKINFLESGGDYVLQSRCKNSIKQFCDTETEDLIGCLRKHLLTPNLEAACKQVVINRIMQQNKDARLNPSLWKTCSKEINSVCVNQLSVSSIQDLAGLNEELHGRVVKCLKKSFVNNLLSTQCRIEVDQIMREAAMVDYRLDPLLVDACLNELEALCTDKPNDKKEDCLRLAFHKRQIQSGTQCFDEMRRVIVEGAADLFVDHELSEVCAFDLNRYCSEIPPGASQQLKCLLDIKDQSKYKLAARCVEMLSDRKELWKLADVSDSLKDLNDLARIIGQSEHRYYLLFILFLILAAIFSLGCLCRPAVFKYRRLDKMK